MQHKTNAVCQADDVTAGQSGDGETHVSMIHPTGELAMTAINKEPMTGNPRERLV